ncbi:MAG: hypothetical protein JKY50_09550 [Oleispira sp.]|nr:hypothetical protein [Oleispira sp.]
MKAGFLRYAETAIAANDGVTTTAITTKAAILGVSDEVEAMGDKAEVAGNKGAAGLEKVKQGAGGAKDSVSELSNSAAQSGRSVQAAAGDLAAFFNEIKNSVYALSDAAGTAFDNKLGISVAPILEEIESLQAGIDSAYVRSASLVRDNALVFDATGINKFKNSVLEVQSAVEISYNTQKVKFLEYMDAIRSGESVNQGFINSAKTSIQNMDLLGQQDLSQLRSALDSANSKLQQMNESAASTVDNLKNELDRLQGNQNAIDQRDYDRKRSELTAAIEDAKLVGNKEAIASYTGALKLLSEVKKERSNQAKEESKPSKQTTSNTSPNSSTTITLKTSSGNKSVNLSGEAGSVNDLLDVLSDFGIRSA